MGFVRQKRFDNDCFDLVGQIYRYWSFVSLAYPKIWLLKIFLLKSLYSLQHIDLAENQILDVQKQSFKDLYLVHINISHNIIQNFEMLSFENCVNMTTLDLSHNQIKMFPKKTFDEASYASILLLSFNQLKNMSTVTWIFLFIYLFISAKLKIKILWIYSGRKKNRKIISYWVCINNGCFMFEKDIYWLLTFICYIMYRPSLAITFCHLSASKQVLILFSHRSIFVLLHTAGLIIWY